MTGYSFRAAQASHETVGLIDTLDIRILNNKEPSVLSIYDYR